MLGNLTVHKQAQHKGVRFGCDQCDYKACQQGDLIKHKNGKHEGVRGLDVRGLDVSVLPCPALPPCAGVPLARVALTFEDIVAGAPPLELLLLAEQGEGDALAAGGGRPEAPEQFIYRGEVGGGGGGEQGRGRHPRGLGSHRSSLQVLGVFTVPAIFLSELGLGSSVGTSISSGVLHCHAAMTP